MPINLLKLPCLVGAMVVTELDYQKIFLLSLCSRRTLFLGKKARITVHKLTLHSEKLSYHGTSIVSWYKKRPEHFVMDAPNCAKEEYRLRSEDFVEIKQITDGKRAFLACDPTCLEFFVPEI
ncbi:Protein CBG11335 [Caenorhabditis briggsae]|uniref:Protein CBG11335 n=1 Tax=Caenorhabditis briggsae TaxID=6238 RepID=A8XD91_CAEBR|nr:Protein CBG11335 [Caenorhabditis briggsae]CAP30610.1 Protein CBG11335 [Caenorhabditis briggsae]